VGSWRKEGSKVGVLPETAREPIAVGTTPYDRIQRGRPMHQSIERFGELNSMMTWAETAAVKKALKKSGLTIEDMDLQSHWGTLLELQAQ
jgi:acetyl-CoA acetyltransferase